MAAKQNGEEYAKRMKDDRNVRSSNEYSDSRKQKHSRKKKMNNQMINKNSIVFNGELIKSKKFESPALYEQKIRTFGKEGTNSGDQEISKADEDEINEILPEPSFLGLHSSRIGKKTHSTHISLTSSDSRDSEILGTKSFSVERHLGRSGEERSSRNW